MEKKIDLKYFDEKLIYNKIKINRIFRIPNFY